jgi:hypothetical protein
MASGKIPYWKGKAVDLNPGSMLREQTVEVPQARAGQAAITAVNEGLGTHAELPSTPGFKNVRDSLMQARQEIGDWKGHIEETIARMYKGTPEEFKEASGVARKAMLKDLMESGMVGEETIDGLDGKAKVPVIPGSTNESGAKLALTLADKAGSSDNLTSLLNTQRQYRGLLRQMPLDSPQRATLKVALESLDNSVDTILEHIAKDTPSLKTSLDAVNNDYFSVKRFEEALTGGRNSLATKAMSGTTKEIAPGKFAANWRNAIGDESKSRMNPALSEKMDVLAPKSAVPQPPDANAPILLRAASHVPGLRTPSRAAMGALASYYSRQGGNFSERVSPWALQVLGAGRAMGQVNQPVDWSVLGQVAP